MARTRGVSLEPDWTGDDPRLDSICPRLAGTDTRVRIIPPPERHSTNTFRGVDSEMNPKAEASGVHQRRPELSSLRRNTDGGVLTPK
jgi:hypothetical protein